MQPYTALFVFIFMAATLHSFFRRFLLLIASLPFLKLYLLFASTNFSVFEYWDFGVTNFSVLHSPKEKELTEGDPVLKAKAGTY